MNPLAILEKQFAANREGLEIVYRHSRMVADKALSIARQTGDPTLDLDFIEQAALLHDIGVALVHAPKLHCFGSAPYICHGVLGREILEAEGLPCHAMICERHIGVGLTVADIEDQRLPLPRRDMSPVHRIERIVTLADLFFSKKDGELELEKPVSQVRDDLLKFGPHKVTIFDSWLAELLPALAQPSPSPN